MVCLPILMMSFAGSAWSPRCICLPLTVTFPSSINSSAFRLEQNPALEMIFWTRWRVMLFACGLLFLFLRISQTYLFLYRNYLFLEQKLFSCLEILLLLSEAI